MTATEDPTSPLDDFTTWAPVLNLLLSSPTARNAAGTACLAGRISRHGGSLPLRGRASPSTRAAVAGVQQALARAGPEDIAFRAEVRPDGTTTLGLVRPSPSVPT
ncbi:hypothetical protein [Streptomyces sp. WAC06614]|uniref:hypothetical protein n=1 Tax=Streptomyces sp. WAC06614 TaxID=2487416 RepID=UPI000F76C75D|nr:hypothetical protein [Streptomyces sp. WAC06614]RSS70276.1 hypothetical protein EF918_27470 [Streptomyces sp. WAC06614]